MPVELNSSHSVFNRRSGTHSPSGELAAEPQKRPGESLAIGLINNMPDGALEPTERQFLSLLGSASGDIPVRLSLYALPEVPRGEQAEDHLRSFYSSAENLQGAHLDGLIVTGREPLAANLADEPYWRSFTRVLEWAGENTYSTIWSCLAAHAAVLHMDGIERIRSNEKNCGVFECARVADHPLIAGTPSGFRLPHSRWNGLSENALKACGYRVLTRSSSIGVDSFVKEGKSLFVFFQGHPEYESNALLLEYRRDLGRYSRGETDVYPLTPHNYFDRQTEIALASLREQALSHPREELLTRASGLLSSTGIENTWQATAARIYGNWLRYIAAQKKLCFENGAAAPGAPRKAGPVAVLEPEAGPAARAQSRLRRSRATG